MPQLPREDFEVAEDRAETEPCERLTIGCCVRHRPGPDNDVCRTW